MQRDLVGGAGFPGEVENLLLLGGEFRLDLQSLCFAAGGGIAKGRFALERFDLGRGKRFFDLGVMLSVPVFFFLMLLHLFDELSVLFNLVLGECLIVALGKFCILRAFGFSLAMADVPGFLG